MATVYLHNALHARNFLETTREPLEHSRNISAVSSATLLTNTTVHSQPTEPLLHQSPDPDTPRTQYEGIIYERRALDDFTGDLRGEDSRARDPTVIRDSRLRGNHKWRRQRLRLALQFVIASWAVFNSVRYFISFAIYGTNSSLGQSFSLALGTSAGVSFSLLFLSFIFAATGISEKLLVLGFKYHHLQLICTIFQYLSCITVFAPAVVNLVLLIVWKDSTNPHYNFVTRCHIDIDIIWSSTSLFCNNKSPKFSIWVAVSCIRVALTLLVLLAYLAIIFMYPIALRQPVRNRLRSKTYRPTILVSPSRPSLSTMMASPSPPNDNVPEHLHSSLDVTTLSDDTSPHLISRLGFKRSRSSGFSSEITAVDSNSQGHSNALSSDNDQNNRFQAVLSQISQEYEDALVFAQRDLIRPTENGEKIPTPPPNLPPAYTPDDQTESSDDHSHDSTDVSFNFPPIHPTLGYDEFGLPYPPVQDIRILNGYVRRMPTIESMGSGEHGSSIGASSSRNAGSHHTNSRPPTRNTLLSMNSAENDLPGSEPESRTNSLSARAAEFLTRDESMTTETSEHGEILQMIRPDLIPRRISSPGSLGENSHLEVHGDDANSLVSSLNVSYHTATMGSSAAGDPQPSLGSHSSGSS